MIAQPAAYHKRLFRPASQVDLTDFAAALAGLIVLAPLLALLALSIRLVMAPGLLPPAPAGVPGNSLHAGQVPHDGCRIRTGRQAPARLRASDPARERAPCVESGRAAAALECAQG